MAVAGARFESYVRTAMDERDIPSLAELARRSGIAQSAWYGWFQGRRKPRRNSLKVAGRALGRTPEQLMATWQGTRAIPKLVEVNGFEARVEAALKGQETRLAELEALVAVLAERLPATPTARDVPDRTTG